MPKTLVVDVGGTHVKILINGETERRAMDSGPAMTAAEMVAGVKELAKGWPFDRVSIGYPGPVMHHKPVLEPHNLAKGWVGFDYSKAFGKPVRIINDAAMQALGSYRGGRMLFLGLGTGLGTALVMDGSVQPMELAHMPYKKGRTFEDYVGLRGLERLGKSKWREEVAEVVERFRDALRPDYIVLGGGNAKKLKKLPDGCELGNNANAFIGGFRLWEQLDEAGKPLSAKALRELASPVAPPQKTAAKATK